MAFLRRLSNPFQNWAPRTKQDDLEPQIKDDVFRLHLYSSDNPKGDFTRIDQQTLFTARIVATNSQARKLLQACHKLKIIESETGRPNTENINRDMCKAMPMLSFWKQRELVMLLFFWEEEITRWRLLSLEESEITEQLFEQDLSEGYRDELRHSLMVVQAKKRLLPSLRDRSGRGLAQSGDVDVVEERGLPTYEDVRRMRASV